MGIGDRVKDAEVLWNSGRYEGALLNVLIAVAATSRLRFANRKEVSDNQAFTQFLEATHQPIRGVEFRGKIESMPRIFYKWLRCELVHEGALPIDIEFLPNEQPGAMLIRAGGAPDYVLQLSHGWFFYLVQVVVTAPENSEALSAKT